MTIDTSLSPKSFAQHDFTDCHLTTADKIYNGIAEGDPKQLGHINNSVPESDQWYVRFGMFDLLSLTNKDLVMNLISKKEELGINLSLVP